MPGLLGSRAGFPRCCAEQAWTNPKSKVIVRKYRRSILQEYHQPLRLDHDRDFRLHAARPGLIDDGRELPLLDGRPDCCVHHGTFAFCAEDEELTFLVDPRFDAYGELRASSNVLECGRNHGIHAHLQTSQRELGIHLRQLFFVQVLIWARISSATKGSEVISETCLRMARVHQLKQRLIDAQQQLNRFLELGFVVQRFGTGDRVIDLVRRKNQK